MRPSFLAAQAAAAGRRRIIGGGGGTDPFFADVKSLLHFDGADAGTTFTDVIGKVWTPNGNAQLDTAQFKFGTASGLFDGTGDYITTPDHADFDIGSGDFTLEMFVRFNAGLGSRQFLCGQGNSSGNGNLCFGIEKTAADVMRAVCFSDTGTTEAGACVGATSVTTGVWYHLAYTRSGSDFRLFLDGDEDASASSAATINNSTSVLAIGRLGLLNALYLNGWMDEFRFTKGVARYTSNFTPPSAAFPDS